MEAGSGGVGGRAACEPGSTTSCYTGPPSTQASAGGNDLFVVKLMP